MSSILFRNDGELDIRGLTTFGLSVKESDNPIGYFGTGLKYAVAVCLRHGQEVTVWSGETRYTFKVRPAEFRGQPIDEILCSTGVGEDVKEFVLPFSTQLGRNWELWMAYRELYCNARDEGGDAQAVDGTEDVDCGPRAGETLIEVQGQKFLHVHLDRHKFILETDPVWQNEDIAIHDGTSHCIYYRGLKVATFENDGKSLLTYNILEDVALTEDRTAKNYWVLKHAIERAARSIDDPALLKLMLGAPKTFEEFKFDYSSAYGQISSAFVEAAASLLAVEQEHAQQERDGQELKRLSESAKGVYFATINENPATRQVVLTTKQQKVVDRVLLAVERAGLKWTLPIWAVEDLGQGRKVAVVNSTMFLTPACFAQSLPDMAANLLSAAFHSPELAKALYKLTMETTDAE